jgi:hypothetical protein
MPAYTPPVQQAYQAPQQQQIPMPQPVLPPPDIVDPYSSISLNSQNDDFLDIQENNYMQWVSATASTAF